MSDEKKHGCETCGWRAYAERKPRTIGAWIWRMHTKICPGWKKYQRELAAAGSADKSADAE